MKKFIVSALVLAMSLNLTACGGSADSGDSGQTSKSPETAAAGQGETITINIGHGGAESTAQQVGCLALKDYLEKNSNGTMALNIYPNNSMGNDDELCQMVQSGNLEMCLANSIIVNYVHDGVIYDLFYNFNNLDDVKKKYMEDKDFLNVMREKYTASGFWLGGYSVHGFRVATANKEITSPEALKGLTFRVMQNDLHIEGWKCMGATPTPFSFSELYTALQQKTIDAQENPIELIYSQKFYEQQTHITKTNHLQQTQQWLVSQSFYDSLSDENRAVLDVGIVAACEAATNYALDNEAAWTKEIEGNGTTIVDLTDDQREVFKAAVAPEWESIKAKVAPEVWEAYTK